MVMTLACRASCVAKALRMFHDRRYTSGVFGSDQAGRFFIVSVTVPAEASYIASGVNTTCALVPVVDETVRSVSARLVPVALPIPLNPVMVILDMAFRTTLTESDTTILFCCPGNDDVCSIVLVTKRGESTTSGALRPDAGMIWVFKNTIRVEHLETSVPQVTEGH